MASPSLRAAAFRSGAAHRDGDQLLGPLPVPHDLPGEIGQYGFEGGTEPLEPRVARPPDPPVPRGAGGEEQAGVVGRGVAIHRDGVERAVHAAPDQRPQYAAAGRFASVNT